MRCVVDNWRVDGVRLINVIGLNFDKPLLATSSPNLGFRAQTPRSESATSVSGLFKKCLAEHDSCQSFFSCRKREYSTYIGWTWWEVGKEGQMLARGFR